MIFFTADTHFGHANILKLCNRPFDTIEEMNESMICRWNARVSGNDTVYIVGDMFFRCSDAETILKRLKGKKRLIIGKGDKFRICHCFTQAVLLALSENHIKVGNADDNFYKQLKFGLNTNAYEELCNQLIKDTSPFIQSDLDEITSSGLVLFYSFIDDEEKVLQHSMICTGKFKWSGVNNTNSLGDANSILIAETDVRQYTNIHLREYSSDRETGGWKDGEMNALVGGIHQMYFVPFHK